MSVPAATIAKGNPLWDFAVWAYAEPGVEKACLALQNRFAIDVNMVLFCAWLAYRGTGTTHLAKFLGSALKMSREWQRTLVAPLRDCRENMKDVIETSTLVGNDRVAAAELRERIKQCELDVEQLQTLALYALVADGSDETATRAPAEQKDDALNNLTVYFAATGVKLDPLGQTHVMRILTAVFGA
jgi:uncharacterized protein (TIGR02444 family)